MDKNQVNRQISKTIITRTWERNTDGRLLQVRKGRKECAIRGARVGAVSGRGSRMCKVPEGGRSLARSGWEKESWCGLVMARKGEGLGYVVGAVIRQNLEGRPAGWASMY